MKNNSIQNNQPASALLDPTADEVIGRLRVVDAASDATLSPECGSSLCNHHPPCNNGLPMPHRRCVDQNGTNGVAVCCCFLLCVCPVSIFGTLLLQSALVCGGPFDYVSRWPWLELVLRVEGRVCLNGAQGKEDRPPSTALRSALFCACCCSLIFIHRMCAANACVFSRACFSAPVHC